MSAPLSCDEVMSAMAAQFQTGFTAQLAEEGCVVVTPYALPDMAALEFVVEKAGDNYRITDAGQTLAELFVNGLTVDGNRALEGEVQRIAQRYQVRFAEGALTVQASAVDLGVSAQRLASAMQAVSFFVYRRVHRAHRTFEDEVEALLIEHDVVYEPGVVVQGKANTHHIPFYVNSNLKVMIEPLSATSVTSAREKAKDVAYQWLDLQRGQVLHRSVVILDDKDERRAAVWRDAEAHSALETYTEFVFSWERQQPGLLQLVRG